MQRLDDTTDAHPDKQKTDTHRNRDIQKQAYICKHDQAHREKHTDTRTHTDTDTQSHKKTHRHTQTQTHKNTYRQHTGTDKHLHIASTHRQINRHRHTETAIQTETWARIRKQTCTGIHKHIKMHTDTYKDTQTST